jgi:phage/plasmid-associated DNA primase
MYRQLRANLYNRPVQFFFLSLNTYRYSYMCMYEKMTVQTTDSAPTDVPATELEKKYRFCDRIRQTGGRKLMELAISEYTTRYDRLKETLGYHDNEVFTGDSEVIPYFDVDKWLPSEKAATEAETTELFDKLKQSVHELFPDAKPDQIAYGSRHGLKFKKGEGWRYALSFRAYVRGYKIRVKDMNHFINNSAVTHKDILDQSVYKSGEQLLACVGTKKDTDNNSKPPRYLKALGTEEGKPWPIEDYLAQHLHGDEVELLVDNAGSHQPSITKHLVLQKDVAHAVASRAGGSATIIDTSTAEAVKRAILNLHGCRPADLGKVFWAHGSIIVEMVHPFCLLLKDEHGNNDPRGYFVVQPTKITYRCHSQKYDECRKSITINIPEEDSVTALVSNAYVGASEKAMDTLTQQCAGFLQEAGLPLTDAWCADLMKRQLNGMVVAPKDCEWKSMWFIFHPSTGLWEERPAMTVLSPILRTLELCFHKLSGHYALCLNAAQGDEEKRKYKRLAALVTAAQSRFGDDHGRKRIANVLGSGISIHDFRSRLNSNPFLLAFQDGHVFDMQVKKDGSIVGVRKTVKEDYVTLTTGVAVCPQNYAGHVEKIYSFLDKIFPDHSVRNYMLDLFAQSLCGKGNHRFNFVQACGSGGNGKTILFDFLKLIFGQYFLSINASYFLKKSFIRDPNAPTPGLMEWIGKRMAVFAEPQNAVVADTSEIKKVTGGEEYEARYCNGNDMWHFVAQFSLWCLTNELLPLSETTMGTVRRMRAVGFDSVFKTTQAEVDSAQRAGVRNCFLADDPATIHDNFQLWKSDFLKLLMDRYQARYSPTVPDPVHTLTTSYIQDNEPVTKFVMGYVRRVEPVETAGQVRRKCVNLLDMKKHYTDHNGGKLPGNFKQLLERAIQEQLRVKTEFRPTYVDREGNPARGSPNSWMDLELVGDTE